MGEYTANYNLYMPTEDESMADVAVNITDNFEILLNRANPTVVAAGGDLPQVGSYELGDRVFRADAATTTSYPSSYILVCKDATWGWHWRPVQELISPWISVPATAIAHADYEIHPTYPLQIAYDSRGWCHWRGSVRKKVANIPEDVTTTIFNSLPDGLRPTTNLMHSAPVTPVVTSTTEAGYAGSRIFINSTGVNTMRFFNTNNATSREFWFTGFKYQPSLGFYYSA